MPPTDDRSIPAGAPGHYIGVTIVIENAQKSIDSKNTGIGSINR
jgi:hypothetical protein